MNDWRRIEAFLEAKSAETGASQNTLSAYARDLTDFHEFLIDQKQDLMQVDMGSSRSRSRSSSSIFNI